MKIRLIFIAVISSLSMVSVAQVITFTDNLKQAFGKVGELRFAEAEKLITQERSKNPDNLAISYLEGALVSVKLFISESESDFEDAQPRLEELIVKLEKAPDTDPQKKFMISQLRLGMAILHGKYRNNFSAGWQFYKAYNLLKSNYSLFPDYTPNYVPLGVLYVAIGSLPDDYQAIASVIGIKGSVSEGMALIKKGYWLTISKPEIRFYRDYFGFIYSYASLELNGDNSISPKSLSLQYRNSSYLIYMQALIEIDKGNARQALDLLKNRPSGQSYYPFNYLNYYTGKVALAFSPDTASMYLNKFLRESTSENYKKSTYRYLSWYAMLINDYNLVKDYRAKVIKEGTLNTGADKQAYREAQQPLNEILIKGRIFFDGGRHRYVVQYLRAQEERVAGFSSTDKTEYYYRLGRAYQELEEDQKAMALFKSALAVKSQHHTFALGNSALQLAVVLEKNGNPKEAGKYYGQTLLYKGFPFYEGLHQKAKAGLDRIK